MCLPDVRLMRVEGFFLSCKNSFQIPRIKNFAGFLYPAQGEVRCACGGDLWAIRIESSNEIHKVEDRNNKNKIWAIDSRVDNQISSL